MEAALKLWHHTLTAQNRAGIQQRHKPPDVRKTSFVVVVSGTNVLHLGILDWHEGSVKIEHLVIVLKHDLSACEGKGWLSCAALSHSCTYFGLSRPGHTKITGFWCLLGALDQTRAGPLCQGHLCCQPTWCHPWEQLWGGTGSSPSTALIPSQRRPPTRCSQRGISLGITKGINPKPLDQSFQGYREPR